MMSLMIGPAGWGPSHQTRQRRRRAPLWQRLIVLGALGVYWLVGHTLVAAAVVGGCALVLILVLRSPVGRLFDSRSLIGRVLLRTSDPLHACRKLWAKKGGGVFVGVQKGGDWRFTYLDLPRFRGVRLSLS
jgi:hypothetical protein